MLESKHVKYGKFSNSRADNSDSSGPIGSIIGLIRALVVIYILTKFGEDWLVDARVLTSKLWTDRHQRTVSDHNSSLSTLCSCELKIENAGKQNFLPCHKHFLTYQGEILTFNPLSKDKVLALTKLKAFCRQQI